MKRHPSLHPLSDDHHRALVLARRLRRAPDASQAERDALSHDWRGALEADLDPHFRIEEQRLLPALAAKGEDGLVARTLDDHGRLREFAAARWAAGTAERLGALLEAHVRFEERVLFPRAEALLSEAELASVCTTSGGERGPGGARPPEPGQSSS